MKFVIISGRTMAGLLAGLAFGLIVCSAPAVSALGMTPVLSLVSPSSGSNVSGTVTFAAEADSEGLVSLQFKVDGSDFGSAITAGSCRLSANTANIPDGAHTVQAVGQDQFGAMTVSAPVTMFINNMSPAVAGISLYNVTTSSATIGWTTAAPADSQVDFGPTSSYGNSTNRDWTQVISHAQTLTGLAANTTYHFRVSSVGQNGVVSVSGDYSFATASATNNPTPTPTPTPTPNPNPTPTPTPPTPTPTPTPNPNPTPRPPTPTPTPTPPVLNPTPTPTPIVGTQTRHSSGSVALPNVRPQTPQIVLTPDAGSAVSSGERRQQPRLTTSSSVAAAASRTGTQSIAPPRSSDAPVTGGPVASAPKSASIPSGVIVASSSGRATTNVPCTQPDPFKAAGGVGLCVDGKWALLWKPSSGGKK